MRPAFENYFRYAYVQRMELVIRLESGRTLERTLDTAHARNEEASRWLVRFRRPEHLRGTTLLSIEYADHRRDDFVYSPDLARVRRVMGAQRADRLAATDFSYEDLDPREVEDYVLEAGGTERVENRSCRVVRGKPRYESQYGSLEWCVDPEYDVILRLRAYAPDGTLAKTLRADPGSIERLDSRSVVRRMSMRDERRGSETTVLLSHVRVAPPFAERTFSISTLEKGGEVPFLPPLEATDDDSARGEAAR
jgi:hypothetical protein